MIGFPEIGTRGIVIFTLSMDNIFGTIVTSAQRYPKC